MKKVFVTLVLLIILVGCGNKKFYLDEEHYEKGIITSITRDELNKLEKDKKNFMVFVYLPGCTSCAEFRSVLEGYIEDNTLEFYTIAINDLKDSVILDHIEFAPSLVLYKEGKIVDALDAASDKDKAALTTEDGLVDWLDDYIYLTK